MLKIVAETSAQEAQAKIIADHLKAPVVPLENIAENPNDLLLWIGSEGIGLKLGGPYSVNPVFVDFISGAMGYRKHHMALKKELIAKAVGMKTGYFPTVIDATAGFGRDAFVLASLGCQVTLLEQNPIVALMLKSGLERAQLDPDTASIIALMHLHEMEAVSFFRTIERQNRPEVIYLDPMFPVRKKSAKVKKDMQVLQQLLKPDDGGEKLLVPALEKASKRVVVKRPRTAPNLADMRPQVCLKGKASRFDIYLTT
ncbi:MAG: class I SAM-dependent methyltransferase [Pseudomonadales bacterium]|nr:class I SAM-dependent methyltransferase [Pseudomonadales bacterium]